MNQEIDQIVINVSDVAKSANLHDLLSDSFGFPDYYGRNWDAFDECIAEFGPISGTLRFHGWADCASRLPRDARLLRSCLEEFAEGKSLRIVWE